MFMSSDTPAPSTASVPPPVEQPAVVRMQTVDPSTIAASESADPGNASVTPPDPANTDQRSAFAEEQERKARQARPDTTKKPVATPAKTPKKVTVEDLINDN